MPTPCVSGLPEDLTHPSPICSNLERAETWKSHMAEVCLSTPWQEIPYTASFLLVEHVTVKRGSHLKSFI